MLHIRRKKLEPPDVGCYGFWSSRHGLSQSSNLDWRPADLPELVRGSAKYSECARLGRSHAQMVKGVSTKAVRDLMDVAAPETGALRNRGYASGVCSSFSSVNAFFTQIRRLKCLYGKKGIRR